MTPLEAARLGDQLGHTSALKGLFAGLVAGFVVTGLVLLAAGATVATGGAAAVVIGALIAGTAGGGLAGMKIGATFDSDPMGPISTGSPDTFLGTGMMQAARATVDIVACSSHGTKLIAQGSVDVFINEAPAARRTDMTECSGKIRDGQADVFFGGPTGDYLEMEPEVPGWLVTTLHVAMWVGAGIATGGAILTVGFSAAMVGVGLSMLGAAIGAEVGGAIGETIGGERGKIIGETVGGFVGSLRGGKAASKILAGRAPAAPKATIPSLRSGTTGNKLLTGRPVFSKQDVNPLRGGGAANKLLTGKRPAAPKAALTAPKPGPAASKAATATPKPKAAGPKPKAAGPKAALTTPKAVTPPKDAPPVRPDTSTAKYGPDSKYQNPDGSWKWPPNEGFDGVPKTEVLPVGTRIDRFGHPGGTYLSPEGTPFPQRALAPKSVNDPYHAYKVVKPLEVQSGRIAPAFDQPGGGVQYKTSAKIQQLIDDGYLVPIDP